MAGTKEPRFGTFFNQNSAMGDMWDVTLGGRAGIWRYGNEDPIGRKAGKWILKARCFRGWIRWDRARR